MSPGPVPIPLPDTLHAMGLEWVSLGDAEAIEERVLSDVGALTQAQSAALWLSDAGQKLTLSAQWGLFDFSTYEAHWPIDETLAQKLGEGAYWLTGEGPSVQAWLPLSLRGECVGLLQLADPLGGAFRADALDAAKALSTFAAIAWKNGRRLKSLQRQGLKDRETGAYHLAYFTDYASREIDKARRYGRTFTLIWFSIENLPQLKARLGAEVAAGATRGVTRALTKIIRDPDVLARSSEQSFFLLLPETDFFGSTMFLRRAAAAVRLDPALAHIEESLSLGLIGGAATFPADGDDYDELLAVCEKRLSERRASLQARMQLEPMPFWDEVELLAGTRHSLPLPVEAFAPPSQRAAVSPSAFESLQWELARELGRDPHSRGLLYVSVPEITRELPFFQGLEGLAREFLTRAYVLGPRGPLDFHPGATLVFVENDARSRRYPFVLWLSEHASFAFIQGRDEEATWAFQTADAAVVEGLIAKLQSEYDLQPF